jgi:hypothetical protein
MRLLPAAAALFAVMLMLIGCSGSNFLVYKDAKHFYVTSKSDTLRQLLCDSGDLARITQDAHLPDDLRSELSASICAHDKVKEQVLAVLEKMTKAQRSALKFAFQLNGYEINTIANC